MSDLLRREAGEGGEGGQNGHPIQDESFEMIRCEPSSSTGSDWLSLNLKGGIEIDRNNIEHGSLERTSGRLYCLTLNRYMKT